MSGTRWPTQQELNGILGGALFHSAFSGVVTAHWLGLAGLLCAYFGCQVVLCFNGILSTQMSLSQPLYLSLVHFPWLFFLFILYHSSLFVFILRYFFLVDFLDACLLSNKKEKEKVQILAGRGGGRGFGRSWRREL